jgi:hypothetical protein
VRNGVPADRPHSARRFGSFVRILLSTRRIFIIVVELYSIPALCPATLFLIHDKPSLIEVAAPALTVAGYKVSAFVGWSLDRTLGIARRM